MRDIIVHNGYIEACQQAGLNVSHAEEIILSSLKGLHPARDPQLLQMLGIPGSGKSTYVQQLSHTNTLVLGFDAVMEKIDFYHEDKKELGNELSFSKWEVCAREIGYEILFRAIESRLNIIFDHGGSRADHCQLFNHVKQNDGYKIKIVALIADEDVVLQRIATRDRHVPPQYISERSKIIANLLPAYRALADEFTEFRVTANGLSPVPPVALAKPFAHCLDY